MSMIYVEKQDWSLGLTATEQGISFENGHFRELTVVPSPMFHLDLEDTHGSGISLDSASDWGSVSLTYEDGRILCRLAKPAPCGDIAVNVVGYTDDRGISWYVDVINHSDTYSVAAVTYPAPVLLGKPLHLFVPDLCGRAIRDAGEKGFWGQYDYPGHNMSMPYFAWWGQEGGIYLGVHDPHACMKTFAVHAGEGQGHLKIRFPAIGAGMPANSFTPAGYVRWEAFAGDWYDATLLYREFVYTSASWLPERGRPDTPQAFKEIPYWICDYIPNSLSQMEARPMTLASVSERYGKDYWVDAAIALKERLGTPVAYHVYNWHEIPFNINYPHFLPARRVATEGMAKLKEAGLYIFPYINAVSWEMDDGEEGFAESFAEVGIHGAAIQPDGQPLCVPYPQKKASGRDTRLAPICPSFTRWHEIMDEVARGMEAELPIDGIYFDQVAAVSSYPCRNPEHDHLPGGGSHWSDGYRRMMDKINTRKPRDKFYFSESNAEVYAKSFDGFLTWVWNTGDLVPAFPAIYAGYVQMIGRYTDGAKRDDDAYFRYHLAQSLLFGQQPGWLNAHVVYNEKRMRFLEQIVHTRYNYTKLFNEGHLLRPPHVACSIPPVTSSGITMEQVLGGVWQTDGSDHGEPPKTVLFVVNVSEERAEADIHLYPEEYGVSCPEVLHLTMEPLRVEIFEYYRAEPMPPIATTENGDALRRALTEKYSMTWEEFQVSHKDLLYVWTSKKYHVVFEELYLWVRMEHRAISFDTALNLLRSLSGDVYVMSEDTCFPDCAGIIIDGVERKGEVARVNAQALADRIEFEWYEDYRLLLRDMYLATAILPADLYVFDETMEHLLVFTHETDYWELEDEDPMRCAASRLCLMAGFELPEQTGYGQIRDLLESEPELKMEISYSCTMLFRQFIITKQAGAEGAAPRYAFDFDANTVYATWEAAEDAKVFNGLSLKEISELNGVRFDLLKIDRKDHTS